MANLIWPVPGFGRVTSAFRTADRPTHNGIDIGRNLNPPAPIEGAAVVAAADGVVSGLAAYHATMGNMVQLDHAGGLRTRYLHNSLNFVELGQSVRQGEVIALVGNTGRSDFPHLHFEVIVDGVHRDPLEFVCFVSSSLAPVVGGSLSAPAPGFAPSCRRPSLVARLFALLGWRLEG